MARETHGISNSSKAKELLKKAEAKQREAMAKDRKAEENDAAAEHREKEVKMLSESILAKERQITEAQAEKES